MKLLKNLLALVSIITATVVFTGCKTYTKVVGEDIGNINSVDRYIEKGSTTLEDFLTKIQNPNIAKRNYHDCIVTRKILSATLNDLGKKIVIIQYGVDSTFKDRQYRTLKDIVLFLSDNEVKNDSVIEDVYYFGYAYLLHRKPKNYYVLSAQELTQWANLGHFYLRSNQKTGYFKKFFNVTEDNILKDRISTLYGHISSFNEENELNTLGQAGIDNFNIFPCIRSVSIEALDAPAIQRFILGFGGSSFSF